MLKQRMTITVGLTVLLLVVLTVYAYKDLKNKDKVSTERREAIVSSLLDVEGEGDYKVELVDAVPLAEDVKIPLPNLNRPIAARISLHPAVKADAEAKIKELVAKLAKDPDLAAEWLILGIYWKTLGNYEAAMEVWEYVAKRWPENNTAFANLGDLHHYYLKNYPLAEQNLKQAIVVKPDEVAYYANLADLYTLSYKEKAILAFDVLKQGIKMTDSTELMVRLARLYKASGDRTEAQKYYQMAINKAKSLVNGTLEASIREEYTAL